ncbi:MAG: hypothetical protein ACD_10C00726G0001, partial [uncultured bacterium]
MSMLALICSTEAAMLAAASLCSCEPAATVCAEARNCS